MYASLSITAVCCFALHMTSGQLIRMPENVVGVAGGDVTLACATSAADYLGWDEYITNLNTAQNIYIGDLSIKPNSQSKYELLTTPAGNYQLTIKSLTLNDGGKYVCKYMVDITKRGVAEVIVLEEEPICTTNTTTNIAVEGDIIEYSCEVQYQGTWAPLMQWKGGRNGSVIQAKDETSGTTVKFSIVQEVTSSHNGRNFTCRTYFNEPGPGSLPEGSAYNIPINVHHYKELYTSPQLTVYYGPQSFEVEAARAFYHPGEKIKLIADSNPPTKTYTWLNIATNETLGTDDTITINEDTRGNLSLRVVVCNIIPIPSSHSKCNGYTLELTVGVETSTTTEKPALTMTVVFIIALTAVVLFILPPVLYYVLVRRQKKNTHIPGENETENNQSSVN